MKKNSAISMILALVLALSLLFTLAACGNNTDTTDNGGNGGDDTEITNPSGNMNVKFFKVGKANATLIRTSSANILIDCGEEEDEDENGKQDDGEKILEYLAEKDVTKLDLVIVSQFNKKHYGSMPTILEGVTVDKVVEPSYNKDGKVFEAYRDALTAANLTPEVITEKTDMKVGEISLTIYPATQTTSSADVDEFNSLAVSVTYGDFDMLLASDIFGARINSLIEDLDGKTYELLQVPFHGTYNDTVGNLIEAVDPDYAVIFASDNNPEDVRVMNLLSDNEITTYVTKNGSVEAKFEKDTLTVKQ